MNDTQLIERLADTDPYAGDNPLPDEIWTPDVALHEIERRTDVQTQEIPTQTAPAPRPRGKKRWLLPALAGAAVVIVAIVVATTLLSGDDEPDVTSEAALTPLEVGEALNLAAITGDWEAARLLYADDATLSVIGGSTAKSLVNVPMAEPIDFPDPNAVDWDGDGAITLFDDQAAFLKESYATGVTRYRSCSQTDPVAVVCSLPYEGYAFRTSGPIDMSVTYIVVEGRITDQMFDFSEMEGNYWSPSLKIEYHEWVRANRPELEDELFQNFGSLSFTLDTVETHRRLIAEWRAQR